MIEQLKTAINDLEESNNFNPNKGTNLENDSVSEWSFSKITSRILIYPFCVFIIWAAITGMISSGKIKEGIVGILIALAYQFLICLLY